MLCQNLEQETTARLDAVRAQLSEKQSTLNDLPTKLQDTLQRIRNRGIDDAQEVFGPLPVAFTAPLVIEQVG